MTIGLGLAELRQRVAEAAGLVGAARACRPSDRNRGRRSCPSASDSVTLPPPSVGRVKSGALSPISNCHVARLPSSDVRRRSVRGRGSLRSAARTPRAPCAQSAIAPSDFQRREISGADGARKSCRSPGRAASSRSNAPPIARRSTPCTGCHSAQARAATRRRRSSSVRPRRSRASASAVSGDRTLRMFGRVAQQQVLDDELDVDQPAAHVLDVPGALGCDRAAHAPAHVGDVGSSCRGSRGRSRTSRIASSMRARQRRRRRRRRARGSAPCAPRSRPPRAGSARRPSRLIAIGPWNCRTAAAACRPRRAGLRRSAR